MALSYRATPAVSQSSGGVSDFPITKQAGTAAGDWIFIYVISVAAAYACTGFTAISDGAFPIGGILYRLADGSEGASFDVTGLDNGQTTSAVIATIAGASATLDPAVVSTPSFAESATSLVIASITLVNSNDWVLLFAGNQLSPDGGSDDITLPAGFTSRATNGGQSGNPCIVAADNTAFGSGATGAQTCTTPDSTFWSGVMIGVTPAAAGSFETPPLNLDSSGIYTGSVSSDGPPFGTRYIRAT